MSGDWKRILAGMSDEELAGKMLVLGFPGSTAETAARMLSLKPAGITLLPRNLIDARQAAALTRELQAAAAAAGAGPLLLGADQEGGAIVAVADGTTVFPGAMALGAAGSPDLTERVALAQGREAKAMGINLNYAPVADVNVNPRNPIIGSRSFGEDPAAVARHVEAAVRGYRAAGLLAAAKHFPGHGAAEVDSHHGLPVLDIQAETLAQRELVPFRAAVAAGVDAIMTAHIVFPALDAEHPATISPAVLQGLLRGELGFGGLILTDCLEMAAIASRYEPAEYTLAAIRAGADLLLISHTYEKQVAARDAIVGALRRGALSRERVAASVARVLAAKERLGPPAGGTEAGAIDRAELLEQNALLEKEAAQRAVTEVWNNGILPVPAGMRIAAVWPEVAPRPRVGDPEAFCPLGRALRRFFPRVDEIRYPADPGAEDVERTLAAAADGEVIVAAVAGTAGRGGAQVGLVRALLASGKPSIAMALRAPYDLAALRDAGAGLAVYDPGPAAVAAAAEVICGQRPAAGRLPVTLP